MTKTLNFNLLTIMETLRKVHILFNSLALDSKTFAIVARNSDYAASAITFLTLLSNAIVAYNATTTTTFIALSWLTALFSFGAFTCLTYHSLIHFNLSLDPFNSIHELYSYLRFIVSSFSIISRSWSLIIELKVLIEFIPHLSCKFFFVFVLVNISPKLLGLLRL